MIKDINAITPEYMKHRIEEETQQYKQEIERLNKKIEQYENPEDMTLMFMWCDEKAKDEIKRLNNIINELKKYIEDTKQDGYKLVWINEYKNYFEAGIEEILGSDDNE